MRVIGKSRKDYEKWGKILMVVVMRIMKDVPIMKTNHDFFLDSLVVNFLFIIFLIPPPNSIYALEFEDINSAINLRDTNLFKLLM